MIAFFVAAVSSFAQPTFIATGKIEYERKINMWKLIGDNEWLSEMKDRMPEYRLNYFDLSFNDTASVYKPGKENENDKWKNFWGAANEAEKVVFQHYTQQTTTAIKQVFDKTYLLQDSLLKIDWRIEDEIRTIAGFDCRKAVGRLYDTLYVVAFFSEQLLLPSGPEQYHGLPGTILGLAFPRYYTTWFATKVDLSPPSATVMQKPTARRRVETSNRQQIIEVIKSSLDWGTDAEKQQRIWSIVL